MKKRSFLILGAVFLIAVLTIAVVACNDGTDGPPVTPPDNGNGTQPEYELIYSVITVGQNYAVTGYRGVIGTELVIPDSYNGLPVTAIGEKAFENCPDLTELTIPDSVVSIGAGAFYCCNDLKEVTLGKNINYIAQEAFLGCIRLETVYYSGSAEDWCGVYVQNVNGNPLKYANTLYADGKELRDLKITGETSVIKDCAFAGYKGLRSVTIETDLEEIGNLVFSGCTDLESVTINGEFKKSGYGIFDGCANIKEISMSIEAMSYMPSMRAKLEKLVVTGGDTVTEGMFTAYPALKHVTLGDSVQQVSASAFLNCRSLEKVDFGNSVSYIGVSAFEGCEKLGDIVLPDSVRVVEDRAFYGSGATSLKLGESLKMIGDNAFAKNNMTYLEIPASVSQIGTSAFYSCVKLIEVFNRSALDIVAGSDANGHVAYYAKHVYDEKGGSCISYENDYGFYYDGIDTYLIDYRGDRTELVLPSGFTASDGTEINSYKIYKYALSGSDKLKYVSVPDCVTEIGVGAFSLCENLSSVRLGNGISAVCEFVFAKCISLTSLTLPDGVSVIEDYAFNMCENLVSLAIPDSVKQIEGQAFSFCNKLLTTENGVQYVDKWAISCDNDITQLTLRNDTVGLADRVCANNMFVSVNLPDSVKYIGASAFEKCTALKSLTLGNSVSYIGERAFANCYALYSLVLPDSVTEVGSGAFINCYALTSLTVGSSVENIDLSAFANCIKLVEVYNRSSLNIVNDTSNGYAGCYAENIYTEEGGSRITDTADGYRFYFDGSDGWLLGYLGEETELTLPLGFTAYDGTAVDAYGIYRGAFKSSEIPVSITIPACVTSFGREAFEGCFSIAVVRYEGSLSDWCGIYFDNSFSNPISGNRAFYIAGELIDHLVIPDNVTGIGQYAFFGYLRLKSLTLGAGVNSIGSMAFCECLKLLEINNGSALNIIAGESTYGYAGYYAKRVYTGENDSRFTDTSDGYSFFYDGTKGYLVSYYGGATDITLPESFIAYDGTIVSTYEIYKYAFYKNTALTSVVMPDSVTSIGSSAFAYCTGLTSVTIGSSVTSIGSYAFGGCIRLTSAIFKDTEGWQGSKDSSFGSYTTLASADLANASTAATYLKSTYCGYYWRKVK